jgi:lambda repressor-like predicted transcriptional regulator
LSPNEIRGELLKHGYTLTDVAKKCKVSVSYISQTIHQKKRTKGFKIRAVISELINIPEEIIWPK